VERIRTLRALAAAVAVCSALTAAADAADNLAVTGRGTTIIFTGTEGRIHRSIDSGLTAGPVTGGPPANVALRGVTDAGSAFVAVGDGGAIYYSNVNGSAWNAASSGVGVTLRAVDRIGSSLVACGDGGTIIQTFNLTGTSGWQDVSVGPSVTVALNDVGRSSLLSYAVGDGGTIVQGNLLANSFPTVIENVPTTSDLRAFVLYATNTLIAVGEGGVILRSTDDGLTWDDLASPTSNDLYAVAVSEGGGFAVAAGEGGVLLWSNDGLVWQVSGASPLRDDLYGADYVDGWFLLVGGTNLVARALPASVGLEGGWDYTPVKRMTWGAVKKIYGAR